MNAPTLLGKFADPKIIKFLGAGLLNTAFGYAVYAGLLFFNAPYLAALFFATIAGVIFNYFSFGRMVFDGHGSWLVFGKFVAAYALIYGVNAALLSVLTDHFLLNPYLGQAICIPLSVLLSWILMNHWVYKND
jgi:putative flippase GtrA